MSIFGTSKKEDDNGRLPTEGKLSIIAAGTVIEGNLLIESDVRIEGRIFGTVVCRARLVIGAQGVIEGNLDAQNASIAGQVLGQVVVRDTLNLVETGRILGDVLADKIVAQAGSSFSGNVKNGKDAVDAIQRLPQPDFLKKLQGKPNLPPPVNLNEQTAKYKV
jgi:cytoskeletal protein CcmA (bactofilin family)